jgi:hypothetical protein
LESLRKRLKMGPSRKLLCVFVLKIRQVLCGIHEHHLQIHDAQVSKVAQQGEVVL